MRTRADAGAAVGEARPLPVVDERLQVFRRIARMHGENVGTEGHDRDGAQIVDREALVFGGGLVDRQGCSLLPGKPSLRSILPPDCHPRTPENASGPSASGWPRRGRSTGTSACAHTIPASRREGDGFELYHEPASPHGRPRISVLSRSVKPSSPPSIAKTSACSRVLQSRSFTNNVLQISVISAARSQS